MITSREVGTSLSREVGHGQMGIEGDCDRPDLRGL
jgi:hypothetical protein